MPTFSSCFIFVPATCLNNPSVKSSSATNRQPRDVDNVLTSSLLSADAAPSHHQPMRFAEMRQTCQLATKHHPLVVAKTG